MAQFSTLSDDCAENLWVLLRLYREDLQPDRDEICGWLNGTWIVCAVRVPGCRARCLLSFDLADASAPVMWHGMSGSNRPCAEARHLAASDRGLATPAWESNDEKRRPVQ